MCRADQDAASAVGAGFNNARVPARNARLLLLEFRWSYYYEVLFWDEAIRVCDSLTENRDESAWYHSGLPNKSCSFSR